MIVATINVVFFALGTVVVTLKPECNEVRSVKANSPTEGNAQIIIVYSLQNNYFSHEQNKKHGKEIYIK